MCSADSPGHSTIKSDALLIIDLDGTLLSVNSFRVWVLYSFRRFPFFTLWLMCKRKCLGYSHARTKQSCMAALGEIAPLEVFGNDYDTPDGTAIRDYIHVCDLADAHVLAVRALLGGMDSAIYNLGSGEGTSVGEMLDCFSGLGYTVPHHFKPRRLGDPARLVADSRAARAELGWKPAHTNIKAIVKSVYQWHQSQTRVLQQEFD